MKKRTKAIVIISLFLLLLGAIFLLTNRSKYTEIEGLPTEVAQFLTQEDLDNLERLDFPIHFGLTPPNIEGLYLANSQKIEYDKMGVRPVGSSINDTYDLFSNQTDDLQVTRESVDNIAQLKRAGNAGYISGDRGCFSVFDIGTTQRDLGCITTSAEIISGCFNPDGGIQDFQISILMLEHNSKFLCERLAGILNRTKPMPEGNIRIISETDGVAEKVE